jgi:hypothetical protein
LPHGAAPTDGLTTLLAEAEIRRLALVYADAFLTRDEASMLSLWAPMDPPAEPPALDERWAHLLVARWQTLGPTMLHVTNHLIRFDDEQHARGRVFCLAQLDRGAAFIDQSILYDDRYVRVDGSWRFQLRRHLLWFGAQRTQHPMRQPAANWPESQLGSGTLPEDLAALWRA